MNPKLQNKLYKKYPKIFKQKDDSMQTTAMCWGIECESGWYWLIDQLCDCIQSYIDSGNAYQIEAVQIKEKFGCLNFYTNIYEDNIAGMIWLAEHMSKSICEKCGSVENVSQTKDWIKTICKKCLNDEN